MKLQFQIFFKKIRIHLKAFLKSNVLFELPASLTKYKLAVYNLFFPYRKKKYPNILSKIFQKKKKIICAEFLKKKKENHPAKIWRIIKSPRQKVVHN